ncbi:MAG TPA: NAD(P)-dependent oxidoreductase [Mycobacteriales bacterium]|nr:NAD(P)-dependent oxidoreductase [Mycobacteriales bacterium]
MSAASEPRVGFIGLGSQGAPMARRLIDAGLPVMLWARRAASLEPYAGTTAARATTRVALGAGSDVLCVCVVNDADVDDVLRGPEGALAGMDSGGVVVVHSTTHPDTCRRLQADFPRLRFLDAPVSGGGQRAADGSLLVMIGGEEEVFHEVEPILATYGDPLVHLGPLGSGQEAKLVNNALFTAQLTLVADVFELADTRGLDLAGVAAVLRDGSGRSYAAEVLGASGYRLDSLADLAGPLLRKDVGILSELLAPSSPLVVEVAAHGIDAMHPDRDLRDT